MIGPISKLVKENPHHTEVEVEGIPHFTTSNQQAVSTYLIDQQDKYAKVHVVAKPERNRLESLVAQLQKASEYRQPVKIKGNYLSSSVLTGSKTIFATDIDFLNNNYRAEGNFSD